MCHGCSTFGNDTGRRTALAHSSDGSDVDGAAAIVFVAEGKKARPALHKTLSHQTLQHFQFSRSTSGSLLVVARDALGSKKGFLTGFASHLAGGDGCDGIIALPSPFL